MLWPRASDLWPVCTIYCLPHTHAATTPSHTRTHALWQHRPRGGRTIFHSSSSSMFLLSRFLNTKERSMFSDWIGELWWLRTTMTRKLCLCLHQELGKRTLITNPQTWQLPSTFLSLPSHLHFCVEIIYSHVFRQKYKSLWDWHHFLLSGNHFLRKRAVFKKKKKNKIERTSARAHTRTLGEIEGWERKDLTKFYPLLQKN